VRIGLDGNMDQTYNRRSVTQIGTCISEYDRWVSRRSVASLRFLDTANGPQ